MLERFFHERTHKKVVKKSYSRQQSNTVKIFRKIKDKISKDIKGMTFEQFNAYLEKNKLPNKTL